MRVICVILSTMNNPQQLENNNPRRTHDQFPIQTLPEGYAAFIECTRQEPKPKIEEVFEQMEKFAYDRRLPEALM